MSGNNNNELSSWFHLTILEFFRSKAHKKYLTATFQEGISWLEAFINTNKYNIQLGVTLCLTISHGHLFSHNNDLFIKINNASIFTIRKFDNIVTNGLANKHVKCLMHLSNFKESKTLNI